VADAPNLTWQEPRSGAATAISGCWRDPLWRHAFAVSPLERGLLARPEVVRLAGLGHHGPAGRLAGWSTSRLEHTLGVWTVVATLAPQDEMVRVAALVHDVGHAPYSHALEALGGVDHHARLVEALRGGALGGFLRRGGVDPDAVLARVSGEVPSPLRTRDGWVHADHLDSWVRGALQRGDGDGLDPQALLRRMRLDGPHLVFEPHDARAVADRIAAEAAFHVSPLDVGATAWLTEMVQRLLDAGALERARLVTLTDAELDALLLDHPATAAEAAAVLGGAARFVAVPPEGARWTVEKRPGYLSRPRLAGAAPDGWAAWLDARFAAAGTPRRVHVALEPPAR
jgi:uncharacterized protein